MILDNDIKIYIFIRFMRIILERLEQERKVLLHAQKIIFM